MVSGIFNASSTLIYLAGGLLAEAAGYRALLHAQVLLYSTSPLFECAYAFIFLLLAFAEILSGALGNISSSRLSPPCFEEVSRIMNFQEDETQT